MDALRSRAKTSKTDGPGGGEGTGAEEKEQVTSLGGSQAFQQRPLSVGSRLYTSKRRPTQKGFGLCQPV